MKADNPSTSAGGAEFSIPRLEDVSPEYSDLIERRRDLLKQQADLTEEHNALLNALDRAAQTGKRITTDEDIRISALLGDEVPRNSIESDRRRIERVTMLLDDCRKAIPIIEGRISSTRRDASTIICQQVRERHAALVKEMAERLVALHRATLEYYRFTEALRQRDVAWTTLHPSHPTFLGSPLDRHSPVSRYLRELIRTDFIPASSLPAELDQHN